MASETTTTTTPTARMRVASMPRPIITAPLSRLKRQSSSIGRWYIILSAILAVVVVVPMLFMLATLPSSNDIINRGGSEHNEIQSSLRHQSTAEVATPSDDAVASAQGLSIHTPLGDIRIHFTPELSGPSSIQYIVDVVRQAQLMAIEESMKGQGRRMIREVGYKCTKCNFYRAETNLLLQGTMGDAYFPTNVELGPCPDKDHVSKLQCPEHDPNCGCHGPIMTRGMVGWAGGQGGPDFFINTFATPVDWWENQHTVWGMIHDDASLSVVENMYTLPTHTDGMRMLDEKIAFSIALF